MFTTDKYDKEMRAIEELQKREESMGEMPWQLTKLEIWTNYTDDLLYELDKAIRRFLDATSAGRAYYGGQTVVVSELFKWIFGRPAEIEDSHICVKIHDIMEYYANKRTGSTTYKGKRIPSGVYKLSAHSGSRIPYSLRLRLELDQSGDPTFSTNKKKRSNWSVEDDEQKKLKKSKEYVYRSSKNGKSKKQLKDEWEQRVIEDRIGAENLGSKARGDRNKDSDG